MEEATGLEAREVEDDTFEGAFRHSRKRARAKGSLSGGIFNLGCHRLSAAHRAEVRRSSAVMLAALARPPLLAPRLPSATAWWFLRLLIAP